MVEQEKNSLVRFEEQLAGSDGREDGAAISGRTTCRRGEGRCPINRRRMASNTVVRRPELRLSYYKGKGTKKSTEKPREKPQCSNMGKRGRPDQKRGPLGEWMERLGCKSLHQPYRLEEKEEGQGGGLRDAREEKKPS